MPSFGATDKRELEMSVRVFKQDGTEYAVVSEGDLEEHGWGVDPFAAVERYRAHRTKIALETGKPSWDHTEIRVKSDEESGAATKKFCVHMQLGVRTTRAQKALRLLGQYLIDIANGAAPNPDFEGPFELFEEEE